MFKQQEEEEIIIEAQSGNRSAIEFLIKNNMDIVYAKARYFFIKGLDRDDVIQEGVVGLFKAIRDYQLEKPASFRGFAQLCIQRQLISAIKSANRRKHIPLNSSTSIDKSLNNDESNRSFIEILAKKEDSLEEKFIYKEQLTILFENIKKELTILERKVFMQYLDSNSYCEISSNLQINLKTVDNALQRARKKIKKMKDDYNLKDLVN